MFKRCILTLSISAILLQPAYAQRAPEQPQQQAAMPQAAPMLSEKTTEILTDAAIAVLIIAASVATYKSMGRPCACPDDTMSNGRRCGGNSAYLKPKGYRPLCQVTDISPAMISAYRASKLVPSLR